MIRASKLTLYFISPTIDTVFQVTITNFSSKTGKITPRNTQIAKKTESFKVILLKLK